MGGDESDVPGSLVNAPNATYVFNHDVGVHWVIITGRYLPPTLAELRAVAACITSPTAARVPTPSKPAPVTTPTPTPAVSPTVVPLGQTYTWAFGGVSTAHDEVASATEGTAAQAACTSLKGGGPGGSEGSNFLYVVIDGTLPYNLGEGFNPSLESAAASSSPSGFSYSSIAVPPSSSGTQSSFDFCYELSGDTPFPALSSLVILISPPAPYTIAGGDGSSPGPSLQAVKFALA